MSGGGGLRRVEAGAGAAGAGADREQALAQGGRKYGETRERALKGGSTSPSVEIDSSMHTRRKLQGWMEGGMKSGSGRGREGKGVRTPQQEAGGRSGRCDGPCYSFEARRAFELVPPLACGVVCGYSAFAFPSPSAAATAGLVAACITICSCMRRTACCCSLF